MENNNYTEITRIVEAYLNGEESYPDIEALVEALYKYAVAAQNGEIEETQENIDRIFCQVVLSVINGGYFDGVYKYPLSLPYIEDVRDELDMSMVSCFADYCLEERDDEKNFFRFSKIGAEIRPRGMYGGPLLVNFLSRRDSCILNLARCYKDGIGTEKDYVEAFFCYMSYHTDHLTVKWEKDCLEDSELADLYCKLKADSDAGKHYPGLHYALAVMSKEGFGTSYDIEKYYEYAKKAIVDGDYTEKRSKYLYSIANYVLNHDGDTVYPVVKDIHAADLKRGDVVRFGRYNHREILWHVITIEDGAVLLLSTDCLESTYIANKKWYNEKPAGEGFLHSKIRNFTSGMAEFIFKTAGESGGEFDYTEGLIPDKNGDYVFLLGVDDIKRYKLPRNMLLAGARAQAVINGYDNCGVEIDPETGTAPWWTSTDGKEPGLLVLCYTDCEFYEQNMINETPGIRPAIRVKLN